jgi:excinuclease UvrABC helicase subunit UvrB
MQHQQQQTTTPSPVTKNVQDVESESTMKMSEEEQQKKERELRNLESAKRQEELTKKTKELFENVSNFLQGELRGCSFKDNFFDTKLVCLIRQTFYFLKRQVQIISSWRM